MKKFFLIILLLAFVLCFGTTTISAQAESPNDLAFTLTSTQNVDDLSVKVTLTRNDGITSLSLRVEYDQRELELTGRTFAATLKDLEPVDSFSVKEDHYPYEVVYAGLENTTETGELFTLNFKVKEGAYNGKYAVRLIVEDISYYSSETGELLLNEKYDGEEGLKVAEAPYLVTTGVPAPTANGEDHTLVIVLGVIGGAAVLGGIAFAALSMNKKKQKKAPEKSGDEKNNQTK